MPIPGQPNFIAPAEAVDLVLDGFKSWNCTEADALGFLNGQAKKGALKLRYTGTRPDPEYLSLTFENPVPVPGAPPLYAGARLIAAQKAGYAAAGIDVGSGSPLDVIGDTGSQLKLAELVKLYEGDVAATEAENKANLAGLIREAAPTAAGYNAATSLLGVSLWVLDQLDWRAGEVRRRFRYQHQPISDEADDDPTHRVQRADSALSDANKDGGEGEGETIEKSYLFQIDWNQLSSILLDQLATAGTPPEAVRGPEPGAGEDAPEPDSKPHKKDTGPKSKVKVQEALMKTLTIGSLNWGPLPPMNKEIFRHVCNDAGYGREKPPRGWTEETFNKNFGEFIDQVRKARAEKPVNR
jgi:hypothetical protein